MSDIALKATDIKKSYHDGERELNVLSGLDLAVGRGESIAVVGRSGTGKSTLLHLLGLLDKPTEGKIELAAYDTGSLTDGQRTKLRARAIGFVFQHYHLLEDLTAAENVALGGAVAFGGTLGGAHHKKACELLDAMGLADRRKHRASKLSGGERQRVAIARALMNDPALLLCDEPTGNLDPRTGSEVMNFLWQAVEKRNTAMVLVTHDHVIAQRANRTLELQGGMLIIPNTNQNESEIEKEFLNRQQSDNNI